MDLIFIIIIVTIVTSIGITSLPRIQKSMLKPRAGSPKDIRRKAV